jgi:hypothetical protein
MLSKWALQAAILVMVNATCILAAPSASDAMEPAESIAAPPPQIPMSPGQAPNDRPAGCIFQSPRVTENTQPPPIQPAQPSAADQILPINLPTALCLSNARPLVIAFAQASVEEAAALLQHANVLWLPNLNVGVDYYRHDGLDQSTDGTIIQDDKYSVGRGAGRHSTLP